MERECAACPPPHDLSQLAHRPKAVTAQFTAQGCVPHTPTSLSVGQSAPPCADGVSTVRVRACSPVPHPVLHVLNDPHVETTQSIAHGAR